ncbi:MAG: response regulator [Anaerolineales bacterium]
MEARVCVIEANPTMAALLQSLVQRMRGVTCSKVLANVAAFEAQHAAVDADVLLLGLPVEQTDGPAAIRCLRGAQPQTPLIVLPLFWEDALESALRAAGADDCVHKTDLAFGLAPAIRRALNGAGATG